MSVSSAGAGGVSEASDSDADEIPELSGYSSGSDECAAKHDGREVMRMELPIPIDHLIALLFTNSKFLKRFYRTRNSNGLRLSPWNRNSNNELSRTVRVTVNVNQSFVGKYESHVTQTVTITKCSQQGQLYSVDTESHNVGVPYADAFYITTHYCLKRISDLKSSIRAYSLVIFTKSVWIRGLLEKKAIAGLEDFHAGLSRCLLAECGSSGAEPGAPLRGAPLRGAVAGSAAAAAGVVAPPRRRRPPRIGFHRSASQQLRDEEGEDAMSTTSASAAAPGIRNVEDSTAANSDISRINNFIFWTLAIMFVICGVLLYKLASLEEWFASNRSVATEFRVDLRVLNKDSPMNEEQMLKIKKLMESLQDLEAVKWEEAFHTTVVLLEKVEGAFTSLQNNLPSKYRENCSTNILC